MSLSDRVAVVTGAAGSSGTAVTRELAAAGCRVALLGTRLDRLQVTAASLGLGAGRWLGLAVDLKDAGATREAAQDVQARFGRLDILVHLVGGWTGGKSVIETPDGDWTAMLDQHLWTTLNVIRATVPHMTAGGWGRIVAVSTPAAVETPPRSAAYAAAKAAEEALFGTLSRELAGSGVTANLLRVRTIDAENVRATSPSAKSAGWTTPQEIASAVTWLCSDAAAAVNGARIPLFGV